MWQRTNRLSIVRSVQHPTSLPVPAQQRERPMMITTENTGMRVRDRRIDIDCAEGGVALLIRTEQWKLPYIHRIERFRSTQFALFN